MIWFTSDQHYGHKNVITYCNRPWQRNVVQGHSDALGDMTVAEYNTAASKDVIEMNEAMMRYHNELVKPNDVVYMLGDFSLGREAVRCILPQLNGFKCLIKGNHDWCHPMHAKSPAKMAKAEEMYKEAGVQWQELEKRIYLGHLYVNLHHMPYQTEDTNERYHSLRPVDKGEWLIHGHVHNSWKVKGRQINVGVDVWDFKPVPYTSIIEIIRG